MKDEKILPVCNQDRESSYVWTECSLPATHIYKLKGKVHTLCDHHVNQKRTYHGKSWEHSIGVVVCPINDRSAEQLIKEYVVQTVHNV